MPNAYIRDIKKIVDALSADYGLCLEEKLVWLALVTDYVETVTRKLEDELAACKGGLIQ